MATEHLAQRQAIAGAQVPCQYTHGLVDALRVSIQKLINEVDPTRPLTEFEGRVP